MSAHEIDEEALLEQAEEALGEGRLEDAMQLLAEPAQTRPRAALLLADTLTRGGALREARTFLEAARARLHEHDLEVIWVEAELLLNEWCFGEAIDRYTRLVEGGVDDAGVLIGLSLCHEHQGDLDEAERLLRVAHEAAPEAVPAPVRVSSDEFDAVLSAAYAALPDEFRRHLEQVRVIVEQVPPRSCTADDDLGATPPDLLGLFSGPTLEDLAEEPDGLGQPPTIHLFQRNLERSVQDKDELREEIRITLYHEIGHFLGHDEEGVEAMGLG